MYQTYIGTMLFPITPGKLTVKINGNNKVLTLINEGEVNLIKSPGLTDITTEFILPAITEYPFATYIDGFQNPKYYLDYLEELKQSDQPTTFKMLRSSPNGSELLWDTNISVTIENYDIVEDAEDQGMDIVVKVFMREYKEWGAKKLVVKKTKKKKTKKKSATKKKKRKTKSTAKTYTVKQGDTLYTIAKKQLGSESKQAAIYKLNKSTMDSAAKKHGHKSAKEGTGYLVYIGTKLKLPKK